MATLPANDDQLTRKIGLSLICIPLILMQRECHRKSLTLMMEVSFLLEIQVINLDPADFPNLKNYVGQKLITTDGTTLLGADDKSGIAEIMTALAYLKAHPEIKHGEIRVGLVLTKKSVWVLINSMLMISTLTLLTRSMVDHFGEIQYETFSAAALEVDFMGRNVHPGTAKNQMINALQLAIDFHNQLPKK